MKKFSYPAVNFSFARKTLMAATLGLASTTFSAPAEAHPWVGFFSWEALGVGGLALGGPAGAAAGIVVGGVVGGICTLLDPADTLNAGIRANPTLLAYTLPVDTSFSASLQNIAQITVDASSVLIQEYKAIKETQDRLAGAKLLGNSTYITNQTLWLHQYKADALSTSEQLKTDVSNYLAQLAIEHPEIANLRLSTSTWGAAVSNARNGIFPSLTLDIYNHYEIGADYLNTLSSNLSTATTNDINAFASMTYAQMLNDATQTCEECILPEPATYWLLVVGFVTLNLAFRRRQALSGERGFIVRTDSQACVGPIPLS